MNLMQFFRDGGRQVSARRERSWRIHWPVFLIGCFWYYFENRYFGWNRLPQSDMELLADGLFMLLIAISIRPTVNGTVP